MTRIEALVFIVVLTVYSFFVQYPNVNQNTRLNLTRAIVHDHTFAIDRYHENTVDKSYYNGHWYADKAPGLSLLAIPVYVVLVTLQPVDRAEVWLGYPLYVVNNVTVALPAAMLVLLLFRWLRTVISSEEYALAVAVVFGLGTLALPFATLFFGHMTSTFFSFAAFYVLWRMRSAQFGSTPLLAAGFLAGLALLIEYPNAFIAGLLAIYALISLRDKKRIILYIIGLAPTVIALMVYNTVVFGGPLRLSYIYSPTVQGLGLAQARLPTINGLWSVTIGPRGLFVLCPVLILALPGLLRMYRCSSLRWEAGLFTLIITGFGCLAWLYYDQLGGVPGPRYLIPSLPFATAAIGFALPRWKWPFIILGVLSIGIMLMVTIANPMAPMSVTNPIPDYWLRNIIQRQAIQTTIFLRFGIRSGLSLLVLAAVLGVGAVGWLAWLKRTVPAYRIILTASIVVAVVLYVAVGFPIDIRHPFTVPSYVVGFTP